MKRSRKNVEVSSNQLIVANRASKIRNNILVGLFIVAILVLFVIIFIKVLNKIERIDNDLNVSIIVN